MGKSKATSPAATMKIETATKPFEIEDKRFYVPGATMEGKCPGCGAAYKHDFGEDYFAYPSVNEPIEVYCACGKCEHEWDERIILRVTLEMAPPT